MERIYGISCAVSLLVHFEMWFSSPSSVRSIDKESKVLDDIVWAHLSVDLAIWSDSIQLPEYYSTFVYPTPPNHMDMIKCGCECVSIRVVCFVCISVLRQSMYTLNVRLLLYNLHLIFDDRHKCNHNIIK